MKILLATLLLAVPVFGQAPSGPVQGPPPKNLTKQADGHVSANTNPANPENFETHIVLQGETLSQISGSVLKDSRLWPQLWEMNEHIVNPHWIYPADKILIRPVTRISEATPPAPPAPPVSPVAAPVAPPEPELPRVPASVGIAVLSRLLPPPSSASTRANDVFDLPESKLVSQLKTSDLYCSGFIRAAAIPTPIKVESTYLRDKAALSTDGEYVRMSSGSADGVMVGSIFQVIRPSKHVPDPSRRGGTSDLGMHYLDVGQIQVVQTQADSALARVVGNCEPVEVGDVMIPFVHLDVPDLPRNRPFSSSMTTSGAIKGSVVFMKNTVASTGSTYRTTSAHTNLGSIIGEGGVIYMNLGKAEGLKAGDLFIVYHGQAAVGEVAVLKVEDKSSSALVTYSTTSFVLGDRVERR